MRIFGREPAMILTAALAVVQLVAIIAKLPAEQQDALSVIVTAVYGILLAVVTRPWEPSAITGGLATILTAIGVFGVELSPDMVSALNAVVASLLALALTMRVSPATREVSRR